MASEKEFLSGSEDRIHLAHEQCQEMRNTIIAHMSEVLGIEPKLAIPLAETPKEKRKASSQEMLQLAKAYVSNWLKKDILAELAGTGSSVHKYEISKESVRSKVTRMKYWAAGMFKKDIVDRLHPELIFEEVWDELDMTISE